MNKLLKLSVLIGISFFGMINSSFVQAKEDKYVLRISHTDRANSIKGKFFIKFKELLEEKHPEIKVVLKEYGEIAKKGEEIDALELGLIDMIAPDVEDIYLKTQDETVKAVALPMLFENTLDYERFLLGKSSEYLVDAIKEERSFLPLSIIGEGFEVFSSENKINNIDSIKEKSLFTSSPKLNQIFYNQLRVKEFDYTDYKNMDYLNKIKSPVFEINKETFINQDAIENTKNVLISNHKFKNSIILINKNWFNKLPKHLQNGIYQLLMDNRLYNVELIKKNESNFNDRIVGIYKENMKNITDDDKNKLRTLARPMHEFYVERINKNVLLNIYKDINKYY